MKSYIKSALLALAAPALFTACSSDSNNEPAPIVEDFEGIQLAIPSEFISTRAVGDAITPSDEEAKISTLTILAYKVKDENGTELSTKPAAKVFDFTSNDLKNASGAVAASPIEDTYSAVPVRLEKGYYHIYLFANLAKGNIGTVTSGTATAVTDWANVTETQLQGARIIGQAMIKDADVNVASGSTQSKYLPMSCYYNELKSSKTEKFSNGEVKIETGKSTAVYADLTLAVAKVSFTLINDKSTGITLNSAPTLTNLSSQLSAFEKGDSKEKLLQTIAEATIDGQYYKLGTAYANMGETGYTAPDLSTAAISTLLGETLASPTGQLWAWNGTVFIPERLYDTNAAKVKLNVKPSTGDDSATDLVGTANVGFERSYCYEVVGHLSPKEISIQVRVKKWAYSKYSYDLE